MRYRLLLLTLIFTLLLFAGGAAVRGQGETETPTPTETFTPTPTGTITPTPDLYQAFTLEPSGRSGAVIYTISVGETANFAMLVFIAVLLSFMIFLALRSQRK